MTIVSTNSGEAPGFRVNLSLASLFFGLASLCLPLAAAVPSILFGVLALRAIRRQGGPASSRYIAFLGMGLSLASTLITLMVMLVIGGFYMFGSKPAASSGPRIVQLPSRTEKAQSEPPPDQSWKVLFRSADPSIWNDDINKGPDHFAMALDLAPDNLRFLRLKDTKSQDYIIIEMTKPRLNKRTDDGRFGWDGVNFLEGNGHHLGIYSRIWSGPQEEDIAVCGGPHLRGWGFGHIHIRSVTQGYSWNGKPIARTVFEIAVNKGPDHFATSVDLAPDNLRFLRMKNVGNGEFVIIELSKQNLGKQSDDGKYGWNGTNEFHWRAHFLGIYHTIWQDRGEAATKPNPYTGGWGFGGPIFNREQGYAWNGKKVGKTVFEIAVKSEALTDSESKKLLKKGVVRD